MPTSHLPPARIAVRLFGILLAAIGIQPGMSVAGVAIERGGSNYIWYHTDDPSGMTECTSSTSSNFNKYPIVANYDQQKDLIDQQLATLYANGQRHLRLAYSVESGEKLNPAGNDLNPRFKANLAAFLQAVKAAGFVKVEFMSGSYSDRPSKWPQWREDEYQRIWTMVVGERSVLAASGLAYVIDLHNEAIPAKNQPVLLQYAQRLWTDYTKAFGRDDTIGFSIITDIDQDRYAQLRAIYGNNPPQAFDLHIYSGKESAYARVVNAHKRLAQLGYGKVPWIIGETEYNDAETAADLARGLKESGQQVLWLTQWPKVKGTRCAVNVVPLEFNHYLDNGF